MSVLPILGDVTLELVTEAIGLLHDGHLTSHPERAAQSGIAVFGQLGLASECAGLDGCKVHPTKLEELPVRPEAAQVASLSQDGQGVDRPDPRDGCQQLIVVVGLEKLNSTILNLIALCDQATPLGENQPEHPSGIRVQRNGQAHRGLGRLINI